MVLVSNRYSDEKTHARCLYCGLPFEHHISKKIRKEHPTALLIIQLYCSKPCEIASAREIEKLRLERESQNTTFQQKYCAQCEFIPSIENFRNLEKCPYCHVPFEFREVTRLRERKKQYKKEYEKRKKNVAENVE